MYAVLKKMGQRETKWGKKGKNRDITGKCKPKKEGGAILISDKVEFNAGNLKLCIKCDFKDIIH